jgi:prepilin-type N-terminal cleavage/methylation domain-containing protein
MERVTETGHKLPGKPRAGRIDCAASVSAEIRPAGAGPARPLAAQIDLFDNLYQRLIWPPAVWHGVCGHRGDMRNRDQTGYTIIEVLIVVLIMGVLAALVLPSIRVNAVRVKMSEALLAFGTCRNMITEIYQSDGEPPGDGVWGCEIDRDASRYVDRIHVDAIGKIIVSLRGIDLRVDTLDLTLTPLDNTGNPVSGGAPIRRWRCGSGLDGTQVPSQYLPNSCRG